MAQIVLTYAICGAMVWLPRYHRSVPSSCDSPARTYCRDGTATSYGNRNGVCSADASTPAAACWSSMRRFKVW